MTRRHRLAMIFENLILDKIASFRHEPVQITTLLHRVSAYENRQMRYELMRFYEINIFDKNDKIEKQYSSLKNGVFNPGALKVEFDILRYGESTPQGASHLTIWGIGPKEMQQTRQNLFGRRIQILAGMSKGLPLAKPQQKGLVIDGYILQVFGNWQGTELRLDFIITTGPISDEDQSELGAINITLPWRKGQKLSVALTRCFQMLSGYTSQISISDRLVLNYDRPIFCSTLASLVKDLKPFSLSKIKDIGYSGIEIAIVNGKEIRVWDNDYDHQPDKSSPNSAGKRSENPTEIDFIDLIGQPTWISFGVVSLICVMRADIQTGDHILMPPKSRPMIQASSWSQYRDDAAFNGQFIVKSVRFIGNSRQPTADSWITIIEAYIADSVGKK